MMDKNTKKLRFRLSKSISAKLIIVFLSMIVIFSLSLIYTFKLLDNINQNHKDIAQGGVSVLADAKKISDEIVSHGFALRQIIQNNITQYNHNPADDIAKLDGHFISFNQNINALKSSPFMTDDNKKNVSNVSDLMHSNFKQINHILFKHIPSLRSDSEQQQKDVKKNIIKSRIMLKKFFLTLPEGKTPIDSAIIFNNLNIIENSMRSFEYNFSREEVVHARSKYTQAIKNITKYLVQCQNQLICQNIASYTEDFLKHMSHKEGYFHNLLLIYDALQQANQLAIQTEEKNITLNRYISTTTKSISMILGRKIQDAEETIISGKIFVFSAITFIFLLSISIFTFYVLPHIVDRLTKLTKQTYYISKGNHDVDIDIKGDDEIAGMSKALEYFRQEMIKKKEIEDERKRLVENLLSSNQQLERFAYICSHDLQEPARMVSAFSQKIIEKFPDTIKSDQKLERYFNFVYDGAVRMQNMIKDILEYSRISATAQPSETVSLNDVVDQQITNFKEMHDNITITRDELPDVQGHRTRFMQLFQNLIGNGLKYQSVGSKPEVTIKISEDDEKWTFTVADNGIGIKQENLTKIFDIFTRLHRRDEYIGSGIGLSICQKVVDSYGGKIWVTSDYGRGAEFYFTIPK